MQRLIVVLATVLFAGKMGAWFLTHSVTILTDALESTVNVVASCIGLYSLHVAAKPRDVDHPYGHAKAELVSSGIEGLLIFVAGILVMYSAGIQLLRPQPIHSLDLGIVVVAITGLINFFAGLYAVKVGKNRSSLVLVSAGKHLLSDAYSSGGALVGLGLIYLTHWAWLDSVVAALFGIVILVTGYRVMRTSLSGIMDEANLPLLQHILQTLQASRKPEWIDLHNLRVVQYGEKVHLDAHMTLPWYHTVQQADTEIHALEKVVQQHFGDSAELFIHIDACQPYQCKLCCMPDCPVRRQTFLQQIPWTIETVWEDAKHGKSSADTVFPEI